MVSVINKRKLLKDMRFNFILLMLSILFIVSTASAYTEQHQLLRYQFEESGSSIILDTSGNGLHGVKTGGNWDNNEKFGLYAFKFDGDNDYIRTIAESYMPNDISIALWLRVDSGSEKETIFQIKDGIEEYTWYIDYTDNNKIKFDYIDINEQMQTLTILDNGITNHIYEHYIFALNENNILTWKDSVLVKNVSLPVDRYLDNTFKIMRVGRDVDTRYRYYDGLMDELRMFDFRLNQSQVNDLYNNNIIYFLETEEESSEEDNITTAIPTIIINSTYPLSGENISNMDSIQITNNIEADCELYINNEKIFSIDDTLAFSYNVNNLKSSQNEYFVYCDVVLDNTKQYEISDKINFHIEKPSKTIDFYLYDETTEELLVDDDLFIVTPCFKTAGLLITNDLQKNQSFYIQKLINGVAYFDLEYTSEYDFCLARGKLNYKDDTFSTNYDIVDIEKQTELGKLFVGNTTLNYQLMVDLTDLYTPLAPEFWGKTWGTLFLLIFGLVIGGLIIFAGVVTNNSKLSMVGVFVILAGMGVTFTTLLGGIF